MTVNLTEHAEAVLRAAFPSMNFELTTIAAKQPRVLEACAALFDAGALAMRAECAKEMAGGLRLGNTLTTIERAILAIDPARLLKAHCRDCIKLSECAHEFGAQAADPVCTGFRKPLRTHIQKGPDHEQD